MPAPPPGTLSWAWPSAYSQRPQCWPESPQPVPLSGPPSSAQSVFSPPFSSPPAHLSPLTCRERGASVWRTSATVSPAPAGTPPEHCGTGHGAPAALCARHRGEKGKLTLPHGKQQCACVVMIHTSLHTGQTTMIHTALPFTLMAHLYHQLATSSFSPALSRWSSVYRSPTSPPLPSSAPGHSPHGAAAALETS